MSEDKPCTLTLPDGTHYDLNSLASASADYVAEVGETSYKLNVCRNVVSEVWMKEGADKVAAFVSRPDGDFSMGQVNQKLYSRPDLRDLLLVYENGSVCPASANSRATTVIRFICSPTDFHAGKPELIAAVPPGNPDEACHFVFEWRSHVACPTNRKSELETGHYIAFGSILLIAFLTWFLGHTLYNRFFLQRRGRDIFPFPRLSTLKMPTSLSRSKGSGAQSGPKWGSWRRSSRSRSGYSNIRADEHDHDEQEGFAGRFSLEDDELEEEERDQRGSGLGEDRDAWRDIPGRADDPPQTRASNGKGKGKVGVHQGLTQV